MTAQPHFAQASGSAAIAEDAVRRLPESAVGSNAFAAIATRQCAEELLSAIKTGQRYRIANAIRALSHTPSSDQLYAIVNSVCDAISANAFFHRANVQDVTARMDDVRAVALETLKALRSRRDLETRIPPDVQVLVSSLTRLAGEHTSAISEHLDATATLSLRLALQLELDPDTIVRTELAARLHDIGNVGIANAIFQQPSPLSAEDTAAVRRHPVTGASILADIPALRHLAPIVRGHHERFDGLGYPDGLSGEQIPLEARIVAVADAFHAMTTDQAHKPAIGAIEALRELETHAGSQFDPVVVNAATGLMRLQRHRSARSA